MYTYLCACTDQQRTDIQRCTAFVGRNEAFIGLHYLSNCFTEQFCREFRHQDTVTSTLQTFCVGFQTEDTDFTVLATVSLQTFESFLSVMQTSSCHVDIQGFF